MRPSIPFIHHAEYGFPFPSFRATLGTFYVCQFCRASGQRIEKDQIIPCFACEQRGGIFPGEILRVDVSVRLRGDLLEAFSRLRCPWGVRLEDHAMPRGFGCQQAWGAHALRRALVGSAAHVLRGVTYLHLEPESPVLWPASWVPSSTVRDTLYYDENVRLAALDGVTP